MDNSDGLIGEDNLDDLIKEAKELAIHMSSYQHSIPPDLRSTTEISEESRNELLQKCEDLWTQVRQSQSQIMALDTETLPESNVQLYLLILKAKALEAEYVQWRDREPEPISNKQDILLAAGKEELQTIDRDLETLLSISQADYKKLKKELEREQQWLDEQQQLADALTANLKELENRKTTFSQKSVFKELKIKLKKERSYRNELLEAFGAFLEEQFPLPQEQNDKHVKRKKDGPEAPPVQWISLHELLEVLINTLMETPHDPYIVIQEEHWPPYIELLLRYGIALRHPADAKRIRLEAFHQ